MSSKLKAQSLKQVWKYRNQYLSAKSRQKYNRIFRNALRFTPSALSSNSVYLHRQVLYGQLLLNPPGPEGSKGRWLSGAI
jgi:hypothetical protein